MNEAHRGSSADTGRSVTNEPVDVFLTPGHPASHGPLTVVVGYESGPLDASPLVIRTAEMQAQAAHRGAEKLFESRDYRQILVLANRHNWLASFGSEWSLAATIEDALGIVVPERADCIRVAMAEIERCSHHGRFLTETLRYLASSPTDSLPSDIAAQPGWAMVAEKATVAGVNVVEQAADLHQLVTGARMHPMLIQVGGLRADVPTEWSASLREFATTVRRSSPYLVAAIEQAGIPSGLGTITTSVARQYGVSGPVARASGLACDLRLEGRSPLYRELRDSGVLYPTVETAGDVQARLLVLAREWEVSADVIDACADRLDAIGSADISVRLPRAVRLPEGEHYGAAENPNGINGWYVVSRAAAMPYRLALRTASVPHGAVLSHVLPGHDLRDLSLIVSSLLIISGDLAK